MSIVSMLFGYRRRWLLAERWGAPVVAGAEVAPVVIGGCGSSGTTLLQHMLDRHPKIVCGAESTVFLPRVIASADLAALFGLDPAEVDDWRRRSRSQADFILQFQAALRAHTGKPIWADKTPENVLRFDFACRHFPRAKFVHVIRDGRDVACSLRHRVWMKLRDRSAPEAIAHCIAYWAERVERGRCLRHDPRYIELRYEDLVADPEAAMRRLLAFLEIEWNDAVLRPDPGAAERAAGKIDTAPVGRWRRELSPVERAMVSSRAGRLLIDLGYERDTAWAPAAGSAHARHGAVPVFAHSPKKWRRSERLYIEAATFLAVLVDPRVPTHARTIACVIASFLAFGPIPARIVALGRVDEVVLLLLAGTVLLKLAPRPVVQELRARVERRIERRS